MSAAVKIQFRRLMRLRDNDCKYLGKSKYIGLGKDAPVVAKSHEERVQHLKTCLENGGVKVEICKI